MNNKVKRILIGLLFVLIAVLFALFIYSEFYTSKGIKSIGGTTKNGGVQVFKNSYVRGGKSIQKANKVKLPSYNNWSYLTQISNFLLALWSLLYGISLIFNIKKLKKVITHPYVLNSICTLLVFVGLVVLFAFASGIYRLQVWTNKYFIIDNIRDLYFHVVAPLIALALLFVINDERQMKIKRSYLLVITPAIYCIFTFIRGAILKYWYPYFIFDAYKVWNILKLGEYNKTYAMLILVAIFTIATIGYNYYSKLIILIRNKIVQKRFNSKANNSEQKNVVE